MTSSPTSGTVVVPERSAQVLDDLPDLGAESASGPHPPTDDLPRLLAGMADRVRPIPGATLTAMSWRLADVPVHEDVDLRATVTRRSAPPGRPLAVGQTFTVTGAGGTTVGHGSLTWSGGQLSAPAAEAVRRSDLGTLEWAADLRSRLAQDSELADATRTFDGAIELVAEERSAQLRVYRGTVLEVTRRTPNGPTFSVVGSDLAWTRLLTAERNDFTARANSGQFGARGSSFEYLRMFKAVVLIAGQVREQWKEQRDALRALPRG